MSHNVYVNVHIYVFQTDGVNNNFGLVDICQVALSVEHMTLEAEVQGSKPALGTWWWGRITPNQPYPKGAAPALTTLLAEW